MKKLLLALGFASPLLAAPDIPLAQQQAILAYLDAQCKAHHAIAQEAARAFGFPVERVKTCLIMHEGPCQKKHDSNDIVVHIAPQELTSHAELRRYAIYYNIYFETKVRTHPIIVRKQRNNFLKGLARTAAVGVISGAVTQFLQNSPWIASLTGLSVAGCSAYFLDRNNLTYTFPITQCTKQEVETILPKSGEDAAVCQALLKQGHLDTVVLRIGQLKAELQSLITLQPHIAAKLTPTEQQSYEYQMHEIMLQIRDITQVLVQKGITNIEQEISRVENHHFEITLRPYLEQLLSQEGPLGVASIYRQLIHEKVRRGDCFTPYGVSIGTALQKIKDFCAQHSVNLANAIKEMATREQKALATEIERIQRTENGQRKLKKMLAQFMIYTEHGLETELDGNENCKKIIKQLETALAHFPKS